MKRFVSLSALVLFLLTSTLLIDTFAGTPNAVGQSRSGVAPVLRVQGQPIPNRYIVVLKAGVDAAAQAAAAGVKPRYVYRAALNGFAAELNAGQLAAVQRNPNVAYVEPDQEAQPSPTQNMDANGDPWGLDRVDQRNLPLSGTYTYFPTGAGVTAYVIDTGLQANHPDFGTRAQNVFDALGGTGADCNGHGTHVGGTIGGTTYGIAKQVQLRGVRVFGCSGGSPWSTIIAGIDYVRLNAVKPAVANMSLSGPYSAAADTATANLVASGVFTAVAAGNDYGLDACTRSPASTASAYTVAASDRNDVRASFTNIGACVDAYGPGVAIKSDWIGSGVNTISGTSMATPHVAGCAALHLSTNAAPGQTIPPATVSSWLTNNATLNVIINNPAGTPNRLLHCYKPDVWIKDKPADTGLEPDPATAAMNMWESQDIWIRHAQDGIYGHQNPEFGQVNYAYARLRNRGQLPGSGTLAFYVANASSGLAWPNNWTLIGQVGVNNLQPGAILDVNVPWNPPGTGHYCMIVRWLSNTDPMSFIETWDVNYNTRYNNTIAWRNLNVVDLQLNRPRTERFILRNIFRRAGGPIGEAGAVAGGAADPAAIATRVPIDATPVPIDPTPVPTDPTPAPPSDPAVTTLLIREGRENDPEWFLKYGTITVDLGPELAQRWRAAGNPGSGFKQIDDQTIQVVDPRGARIDGIRLDSDEQFEVSITFEATQTVGRGFAPRLIEVIQLAEGREEAIGGVSYTVNLPTQ